MTRKRSPVPPTKPANPIGDAIDRVEARKHDRAAIRVPILGVPHQWPEDADVTLQAPDDPTDPVLMIWDPEEGAWRLIFLPPKSRWRIRPDGPQLWKPTVPS